MARIKKERPRSVAEESPSTKRARTTQSNKWRAGTVKRVVLDNFMTYSSCTINPGEGLNLVLGANGTGKSSFVCALCVGLGGSTKLLGRADSVKEFVRRGQSEGSTEIWLATGEEKQVVKIYRKIRTDNKSEWKINRIPANAQQVKEIVSKYNIQLDNLCQFLPQDKVVEFARLRPDQLLVETERALGDAHLHRIHMELIEMRNNLKSSKDTLDVLNGKLESLRQANEGIERDVERFQKREQLLEKVRLRELKRPWLEFSQAKNALSGLSAAYKEKRQQLKEMNEHVAAVQKPLKDAQAATLTARQSQEAARRVLTEAEKKKAKLDSTIEEQTLKVEELKDQIKSLSERSQIRKQKISSAEADVEKMKRKLADLPVPEHDGRESSLGREVHELDYQQRVLEEDIRRVQQDMETPQQQLRTLNTQLQRLDDHKIQKLRQLENRFPGIMKVWEWVRDNPGRFRGKVYGPLLTEVTVEDPQLAEYLEMQVNGRVWSFFVTEHREDQDLLLSECTRLIGRNNIIVTNYAGNPNEPLQYTSGTVADYAQYGVTHTLDQALKNTPAIIAHVLDDEAGISRAFVGSSNMKPHVKAFLDGNQKVGTLYLPELRYTVLQSRYNKAARGLEESGIHRANLLRGSVATTERQRLIGRIRTLEESLASFSEQIDAKQKQRSQLVDELNVKQEEYRKTVEEGRQARRAISAAKVALKSAEKQLDSIRASPEPLRQEPELKRQLGQGLERLAMLVGECSTLMQSIGLAVEKFTVAELICEEAAMCERRQEQQSQEVSAALRALQSEYQAAELEYQSAKTEVKKLREKADKDAPLPADPEEKAAHKAKLAALTDDLEELIQEIDDLKAQADAIICCNPRVLQEYKKREADIQALEGKLADASETVTHGQSRIDELKSRWLPELQSLVEKINATFRVNFSEIGFAGEVRLKEDDDFDKYEIQIMVKFRSEEELTVLTASRQSGGERSVCTILYLIALQGVTESPFRVVDEINQGMDPNNERKVFKQLVESACKPGTPQCFLLTPKLLPDLPFNDDVRVLNIFNGPWTKDVAQSYSLSDLLPAAAGQAVAA